MTRQETLLKLKTVTDVESFDDLDEDTVLLTLSGPLKFSDLDAVSSILKTERIDIGSEGWEYSTGPESRVTLTCYGVKFE